MRTRDTKLAGIGVIIAAMAFAVAQSGLPGFGVKDSEIKRGLAEAFIDKNLPVYPDTKAFNAAGSAARVAFVRAFLATAKAYSETAAFKADYAKRREGAKPTAPEAKGSADDQVNAQLAQQRKELEDTKAQVAKMSPDMQKQMQPMLKMLEDQINQTAKDPKYQSMMKQSYEQQAQEDQKNYQKDLAEWQADYPESPNALIARRLREFLDLTNEINFDAKLTPAGNGKMRFADQQYESKSFDWKLCYRAGREPVAAARAFVTEWLHQLGAN